MHIPRLISTLLAVLAPILLLTADDAVFLENEADAQLGWTLSEGREFPGAKGSLAIDADETRGGKPALKLSGDFTAGGNYVAAIYDVPGRKSIELDTLAFWVKAPGASAMTVRLMDSGGMTHQVVLKLPQSDEWQLIRFQADAFFNNERGETNAGVRKYESWGGKKGAKWSGKLRGIAIIAGRNMIPDSKLAPTIWFAAVQLIPKQPEILGPEVEREIQIDDILQAGELAWGSWKLKNPQGGLEVVAAEPQAGSYALKAWAEFGAAGGAFVASKSTGFDKGVKLNTLRFRVKSTTTDRISLQIVDGSGQTHQRKGLKFESNGEWQEIVLTPKDIAGVEHWKGADDGKWHDPLRAINIIISDNSGEPVRKELLIRDVRAQVTMRAKAGSSAKPYHEDFETAAALPEGWQPTGDVSLSRDDAFAGQGAIRLARTIATINEPCRVVGPAFAAEPGKWTITGAADGELYAPDHSFHGRLNLEALGGGGQVLERWSIHEQPGNANWTAFSKDVTLPAGTAQARFVLSLEKTYGHFRVDELKAVPQLELPAAAKLVERIKLNGKPLGNLFFPGDALEFTATVEALKPLNGDLGQLRYVVTDYWGAEQGPAQITALEKAGYNPKTQGLSYKATITLDPAAYEQGKYYELHAAAAGTDALFASFAVLPEPVTWQYKPAEVPFSIRNWDGRIPDFVRLTHRIGIRNAALWSHFNAKDPTDVKGHTVELCEELGIGWTMGMRHIGAVERGSTDWTYETVYESTKNFMETYKGSGMTSITLGNEPHGTKEQIATRMFAYKAAYDAAKAVSPEIPVVATSIPADERYFELGYHQWADAYDFHVYEDSSGIRKQIRGYKELMAKYDAPKPIWSTELGLNSQGMSRSAVAAEMVRKFCAFFAEGGEHMAWFTIMYPDPEGKSRNSSGSAHNTFYSDYNMYCPKLDAVMLYNLTNGIAVKKFADEHIFDEQLRAFLFRDTQDQCIAMVYTDEGHRDIAWPMAAGATATVTRLDGSKVTLRAQDGSITLRVSPEPLLIEYTSPMTELPASLDAGRFTVTAVPGATPKGSTFTVATQGGANLRLLAPPTWGVERTDAGFAVTVAGQTEARAGRLYLQDRDASGAVTGEIGMQVTLTGRVSASIVPNPPNLADANPSPGVQLRLQNHEAMPKRLVWEIQIEQEYHMANGQYSLSQPQSPSAHFAAAQNGTVTVPAGATEIITLPLAKIEATHLYRFRASVTDDLGRRVETSRMVGGFMGAPKVAAPLRIDGKLDDADWQRAQVATLTEDVRYYSFNRKKPVEGMSRDSTDDLSGSIRFLWDDTHLYIGVEVTDDVFANPKQGGNIWNQDSLQFFVDPNRTSDDKVGNYDYSVALGAAGLQAWCHTAADSAVPAGEVPSIQLGVVRDDAAKRTVYEVGIPWDRLRPFSPAVGANIGLTTIINEDDGPGREGFFGWFSGAHAKQLDMVGDIVLQD